MMKIFRMSDLFKRLRGTRKAPPTSMLTELLGIIVLLCPQVSPAQHTVPSVREVEAFAEHARSTKMIGKPVHVPDQLFNELMAEAPEDYPPCDRKNRDALEAHQILLRTNQIGGLAIKGRGECFCSPTGNCAFWIYRLKKRKYRLVLETDMVQVFGFLASRTRGYPDLVAWSHGSATESHGRLFRFDGEGYTVSGAWEEEYEYLDENGQIVRPDKPRVTSYFANKDTIPE
jgi:hypothetical protein